MVSNEPGVIMLLPGMTAQGAGRYIFGSLERQFSGVGMSSGWGVKAKGKQQIRFGDDN
jgi:hypothetical protein